MTRLSKTLKNKGVVLAMLAVAALVSWSCEEEITFKNFDVKPQVIFYAPAAGGTVNPKDDISVAFHDDVALADATVTFTDENNVVVFNVTETLEGKDDTITVASTGRFDILAHTLTALVVDGVGNSVTSSASVSVSDIPPTVGIIGEAAAGWSEDVDMLFKDDDDPANQFWFLIYELKQAEMKFRWDDEWDINWGDDDVAFPAGTAEQDGANIPVDPAGLYWIQLNTDKNGSVSPADYDFEEITTVGIIGDGTPTGWGDDTDMIQDPNDPNIWTINIDLTPAQCKFRANNDWRIAWGSAAFPNGVATYEPGAGNMIIDAAGNYDVTFNAKTGSYSFVKL